MAIKWQEKPVYWLGVTNAPYPRFKAWQSNDAADNGWCLNIIQGADQEPVEIREIRNSRALAEFAEGFLEEVGNVAGGEASIKTAQEVLGGRSQLSAASC